MPSSRPGCAGTAGPAARRALYTDGRSRLQSGETAGRSCGAGWVQRATHSRKEVDTPDRGAPQPIASQEEHVEVRARSSTSPGAAISSTRADTRSGSQRRRSGSPSSRNIRPSLPTPATPGFSRPAPVGNRAAPEMRVAAPFGDMLPRPCCAACSYSCLSGARR
jgi:hypothetical protein